MSCQLSCLLSRILLPRDAFRPTQLNHVSDHAHDQETHADSLRDAQEFPLVRYVTCQLEHALCSQSFVAMY